MTNQNNLENPRVLNQHTFINRLIEITPIERIFINYRYREDVQIKELTILIPKSATRHPSEVRPLLDMVMKDYEDCLYRVFTTPEVKRILDQGSLDLYVRCRPDRLFYKAPGCMEFPLDTYPRAFLRKADYRFKNEQKKVLGFKEGFQFYYDRENYSLACFMLHQVMELSYRTIAVISVGKEKISHSISSHQKFMRGHIGNFEVVFDLESEQDKAMLDLLDASYRAVRYEQDFAIEKEQLLWLLNKADQIEHLMLKMYHALFLHFIREMEAEKNAAVSSDEVPAKVAYTEDSRLNQIIAKISGLVPVRRIYNLARHANVDRKLGMFVDGDKQSVEVHYYLLVICNKPCTPEVFNIQCIINQDEKIEATVTLLMHNTKDVQGALQDHQPFLYKLLREGELVYGLDSVEFSIPELDADQVRLHKAQLWYNRFNRAIALMEAADNVTEEENGIVMASMLSQAMVQICLVYIEEKIGYRPNQLSLKHLFALCRMIDPMIDEVFPVSRKEDGDLFNFLLDADRNMRYRTRACIDTTDQCMLLRRCNTWMEHVRGLKSLPL
ncbi:HEPN domain-containing protein [Pedobacter sp. GR22-6]|uniref:HEPN domain-containing protein n=1 Tax=Pedobacter sp. GR22-6 TaxID=3127957 RepID=UPI00307F1656